MRRPCYILISSSGFDGTSHVISSGSNGASRVISSGSDGAFCVSSSGSDNASYISCLRSCDAGCFSGSSSCTSSCGDPLHTTDSFLLGFTPRSSLPTPSLPVLSGPLIHYTNCLSTIFLVFTSNTLNVPLGKLRRVPMNAHFSPLCAILSSRTLRRAYSTARND